MSVEIDLLPHDNQLVQIQEQVRNFFNWDVKFDIESAIQLLSTVESTRIENWTRSQRSVTVANLRRRLVLRESKIAVLGAAVEESEIISMLESPTLFVAADGAVGVLSSLPDSISERAWSRLVCVVSDADGGVGTIEAVKRSIPIILHAHGDNISSWRNLLGIAVNIPNPPRLVLTHQTSENIDGMYNPGGFTDGDRAICFLKALGVPNERILLLGTRTDIVGKWSGETNPEEKLIKLQWMAKVLDIIGIKF
ncbi:MAG: hypothetical protein CMB15_05145 [Euryarchaeota archaeon]|nr:hypothetical protein [Euryarchaeota archaeon]|tara:strand:- start:9085 stop:9840 length:756 start_codon:yes stop_codon:yes gene_type:complete